MEIVDSRTNSETSPKALKGEATWQWSGHDAVVQFLDPEKDKAFKITIHTQGDTAIECRNVTKTEVSMMGMHMKVDMVDTYSCTK
jgi:hypothetical protein